MCRTVELHPGKIATDALPVPVLGMAEDERGQHPIVFGNAVTGTKLFGPLHNRRDHADDGGAETEGQRSQHGVVAHQMGVLLVRCGPAVGMKDHNCWCTVHISVGFVPPVVLVGSGCNPHYVVPQLPVDFGPCREADERSSDGIEKDLSKPS